MTNISWIIILIIVIILLTLLSYRIKKNSKNVSVQDEQEDCGFGLLNDDDKLPEPDQLFKDIEIALKQVAPEISIALGDGAIEQDFQDLEALIGVKLPYDFAKFYEIHNGQKHQHPPFYYVEEFLSINRIMEEWTIWKDLLDKGTFNFPSEPQNGIKNDWWNPKWIPITNDGNGNHLCLDLDPAEGGTYGQIIAMEHDNVDRVVVANSLADLLYQYLLELKSGNLYYSDDYGGIVEKWED